MHQASLGYIWILLAALCWSLLGIVSRVCLDAGVLPLETAFWRAAVGCLLFLIHAACTDGRSVKLGHALLFVLFGAWGVGIFFASLQYSIRLSGGATAVILLYTAPVWVALFARLFFRERISRRKWLAMGIALAGTALVSFSGGSLPEHASPAGIAWGLLAGLCYASHYPFYRWWQARYSTASIYALMLLGGLAALGLSMPVRTDFPPQIWLWLTLPGILTCYLAYVCYGLALRRISLVRAAVICNLEPVLGTLWVWLFRDENFLPAGWLGSALVLASVVLLSADPEKD